MSDNLNNEDEISADFLETEAHSETGQKDVIGKSDLAKSIKTWFLQKSTRFRIISVTLLSLFALILATCGWCFYRIHQIERFPFVYPQADDSGRKVWLIVGSDSRKYGHLKNTTQHVGERADLIYVAKKQGDKLIVASIPRDIDVDYKGTPNRLTLMLWVGPLRLEKSLCNDLQIPVGHMLIGTMDTIEQLVNALGGVPVELPSPYRDREAHISLDAGKHLLDGDQTIAYVRSRYPEYLIDGKWKAKDLVTGAESRISHSQYVIKELRQKLEKTYNPFTWIRLINGVTSTIRIDDMTSISELKELMTGKIEMTTIDVEPISADKLHYKLTDKGIKQLEDLGFRQKCKM